MRPIRLFTRRSGRVWVFGLVLGIVAGAASIYLLAHPAADGVIAATLSPN
jgi:hypothetical protein